VRLTAVFVYSLFQKTNTHQENVAMATWHEAWKAKGLPEIAQFSEAMHHYEATMNMPIDNNKDTDVLCCGHTGSSVVRNQLGKIAIYLCVSELACKQREDDINQWVQDCDAKNFNMPGMREYVASLRSKVQAQKLLVATIARDVIQLYKDGTVSQTYKLPVDGKKITNRWNSFMNIQYELSKDTGHPLNFREVFVLAYNYSKGIYWAQEANQARVVYVEAKKAEREQGSGYTLKSDLALAPPGTNAEGTRPESGSRTTL
jgi:hypothetical protein